MKLFRGAATVFLILAALGFIATFFVEASFAGRSKLIQRVQVDRDLAAAFGGSGQTNVGSPQRLIIEDEGAFVGQPASDGLHFVDEGYLKEKGIYPLQMQSVEFVANMTRLVSGLFFALCAAILVWLRKVSLRSA